VVRSRSRLVVLLASLSLLAGGLLLGGAAPSQAIPGAKSFAGAGFGTIPDGGLSCSPSPGTPRDVTFNVTGMGAVAPSDVRITGLMVSHTFVGDLTVTLIAPDGTTQKALFGRTGAFTAGGLGDNSNLTGPYTFADDADVGNPWWNAAQSANDTTAVPAGSYRASEVGGTGAGGPSTQLTPAFAGVTHPNGTWTLRFVDTCGQTIGTVTAATLEMVPGLCAAEKERAEVAELNVTAANAAVPPAAASAVAADKAVQDATAAVSKASKAVDKAEKKLKNAKASGDAARITKAKKKLKAAKKTLKSAKTALATAQQTAAAAHQKLTGAQAAASAAQAELAAAQAAATACQNW